MDPSQNAQGQLDPQTQALMNMYQQNFQRRAPTAQAGGANALTGLAQALMARNRLNTIQRQKQQMQQLQPQQVTAQKLPDPTQVQTVPQGPPPVAPQPLPDAGGPG